MAEELVNLAFRHYVTTATFEAATDIKLGDIVFVDESKSIYLCTESTVDESTGAKENTYEIYDCSDHDVAIEALTERLGLLEDEITALRTLVETNYALKTEVESALTEAKTYADKVHTAIPTADITALFA